MYIDITLKVTPKMTQDANHNEKKTFTGHLGTHFDVMNKEFPLEYIKRDMIIFDVSNIDDRDIDISDIDLELVKKGMFVAFYSGFMDNMGYGTNEYFKKHPQLSYELIDALLDKHISIIGLDFAGMRRGKEHTPTDQYCADKNVFIIENLCHLDDVLKYTNMCIVNTYPMNFSEMTGLPCRVVVEVEKGTSLP